MKFIAQFYQSDESHESPHALTPDEDLWAPPLHDPALCAPTTFTDLKLAVEMCQSWGKTGNFKSSRVVEVDEENLPISVRWMSLWEAPLTVSAANETGSTGTPGFACKLQVWMDREQGPPDHWHWADMFHKIFKGNNNAWDLEYGREVDRNGRQILWSLKLNLWPVGKKPPEQWAWWKILGKQEEEAHEVEFIRQHEIEPRSFPDGEDLVECAHCGKVHLKKRAWVAWNPDTDAIEYFDRCLCIDLRYSTDHFRIDPDGEETEDPGCEFVRASQHSVF